MAPANSTKTQVQSTPGPWFVGAQNDALFIIDKPPRPSNDYPVHDFDVAAIAKVYHGNSGDANARLIAAAPDMYTALKHAERFCPCGARPESPHTHSHVTGCPIGDALAKASPSPQEREP